MKVPSSKYERRSRVVRSYPLRSHRIFMVFLESPVMIYVFFFLSCSSFMRVTLGWHSCASCSLKTSILKDWLISIIFMHLLSMPIEDVTKLFNSIGKKELADERQRITEGKLFELGLELIGNNYFFVHPRVIFILQ